MEEQADKTGATPEEVKYLQPQRSRVVGASQAPVFYSNIALVIGSPFDIQVVFAEIAKVTEEELVANARVRVIMSPEQAVLLHRLLGSRIQGFVREQGPLRGIIEVDDLPLKTEVSMEDAPPMQKPANSWE